MTGLAAKLLILSLTIAANRTDEFEKAEDARSVPPKNEILNFLFSKTPSAISENEFEKLLQQPNENDNSSETDRAFNADIADSTFIFRPEKELSAQNVLQYLKKNAILLLEKIVNCRTSYYTNSNQTPNLELYDSLLGDLMRNESKALKATLRHCNISDDLVDKLKAKLPQLEFFQRIFVLVPRNKSSETLNPRKSTQQPIPMATRIYSPGGVQAPGIENNLKLKIGDEWIPVKPRVSHMSHIYLGSSLYPMLTEESRILDKEHTLSGSNPTKETFAQDNEKPLFWLKNSSPTPIPHKENTLQVEASSRKHSRQSRTQSRLSRSLQKNNPTEMTFELEEEATVSRSYVTSSTSAPQRLDLLPKNSYDYKSTDIKTKCPLDVKQCAEDFHYQVITGLCNEILTNFKKFFQAVKKLSETN